MAANPGGHRKPIVIRLISLLLVSIIVVSLFAMVSYGTFPIVPASAQENSTIQGGDLHISFKYVYHQEYGGTMQSWSYTGSAELKRISGGYNGTGTGHYDELDVYPPTEPCTSPHRTTANGPAELTVHAMYSIDNSLTGGPDTSMYNSSTSVIELIYFGKDIPWVESPSVQGDKCIASTTGTYDVGGDCHFYGIDLDSGGTFEKHDEDAPDYSTCSITVTPLGEDLHIYGTVKGNFGSEGTEGLSNSRVVMAKLEDEQLQKLSNSKPNFSQKTATSDNSTANYEFNFHRGPGKIPVILVVSLLWYEGKPEFAITNGKETNGRLIPVYQALCVDDNAESKCEKWKETEYGYEAEVNFEYGNEDKLVESWSIVEPEDLMGNNLLNSGGPPSSGTAMYSSTGSTVMMADSAYMYYNSYRAMKYFEALGLRSSMQPLVIRSHDFDPGCPDAGAWYSGKAIDASFRRSFGDLGTNLEKVDATGGEIVMCDVGGNSSLYYYLAPKLPLWHEIGHYLQFQMYDPLTPLRGTPHKGYENPSTNDSLIEGFAGFVAILIDEYYGGPFPYFYNYQNIELDMKIWGSVGTDEEEAIAGILWDFHDPGREINLGYTFNGTTPLPISRVYSASMDDVTLDAKTIMTVIERNQPKTIIDVYNAFVGTRISAVNLDMIYVNHGVFADVADRNYVHDSAAEKIGESGSKSSPVRLVRSSPPPQIPGSYIVSDVDATYNVTVSFEDQHSYYDYSYLREMKAGEKMYFRMPPQYYPSVATLTPISNDGKSIGGGIEIDSGDYWAYINSNPPEDGVFKQISVGDSGASVTTTAVQYIQNVKDLLKQASTEYKAGNVTGAEAFATTAYLDNFEYVEEALDQRNATELKDQIEENMRVELIGLIKDGAEPQAVDDKIAEINSGLDEAIVIVPEFPPGVAILMSVLVIMVFLARSGRIGMRLR